jgi:NAD(P)-dependent dehydrogenase (short-subunit alcohol dehydrogenase family)
VLAVRNAERGAALRDSLQAEFPRVRFALLELDVASLASVHMAAAQLEEPLDAIALNAGGMGGAQPQTRTADGPAWPADVTVPQARSRKHPDSFGC